MENNLREQVLDKMTKVCTCRAISRASIKDAIKTGAKSVEEVARKTGSCSGSCKGFRCKPIIEDLIIKHLNK